MADQSIDSSPIMIQRGLTQLWPRAFMTSQNVPSRSIHSTYRAVSLAASTGSTVLSTWRYMAPRLVQTVLPW